MPEDSDIADRDALAGLVDNDAIGRGLGRLSPEHRAVVVLRFWADLSTDAIAERLGVPGGTVRSRLHRARGMLLEKMKAGKRACA